jgi:hypothetical protein
MRYRPLRARFSLARLRGRTSLVILKTYLSKAANGLLTVADWRICRIVTVVVILAYLIEKPIMRGLGVAKGRHDICLLAGPI